jgi:hypothetical protein
MASRERDRRKKPTAKPSNRESANGSRRLKLLCWLASFLFGGIGISLFPRCWPLLRGVLAGGEVERSISRSPLPLEELVRRLKAPTLTRLQRDDSLSKHDGRIITWEGLVSDVAHSDPANPSSNLCVTFYALSQKGSPAPDLFIAMFPRTAKSDLSDLSGGDEIEFEGKLEFTSSGGSYEVSVTQCTLLRHEKRVEP